MRVVLRALGASIAEITLPGRDGDVCVTVDAGISAGKSIGRYVNRIARGRFTLDGTTYQLLTNENGNTLHGGPDGFSKRVWETGAHDERSAAFSLHSTDGDQGFPGAVDCTAAYELNEANELRLEYRAQTSAPTVVNFTNHIYFNLRGGGEIASQELHVLGSRYTPLDGELIPTGAIDPVEGTIYDFRSMRPIGGEHYDVNIVLDRWDGSLRLAGEARDPQSGRGVQIETTQPGLQLYTGKPNAFALETQHFADSPNHPNFPSTVLRPGETFRAVTIYRLTS